MTTVFGKIFKNKPLDNYSQHHENENGNVSVFIFILCLSPDISGVCEVTHIWSLWVTTDSSGHTIFTDVSMEICS